MEKDKRRGERRDRSWHYGKRAQRIHLHLAHPLGPMDCLCERSVWFFRKGKAIGCRCRAKKRGAPKIPGGMCAAGESHYRDTVAERIRGRRLARAWLGLLGAVALEDVQL